MSLTQKLWKLLALLTVLALLCAGCDRKNRDELGREPSGYEEEEESFDLETGEESSFIDPYREEMKVAAEERQVTPAPVEESVQEPDEESVESELQSLAESSASAPQPSSVPVPAEYTAPAALPEEDLAEPSESSTEAAQAPDTEVDGGKINEPLVEQMVLQLINEDRVRQGAEPLGMQEEMRLAAGIRSAEVLQSLSHSRPDGTPYNTAFDEAGFSYAGKYHGENVLYLQSPRERFDEHSLAARIFEELQGSPGHYSNMIQPNYVQAGIGIHIKYDSAMKMMEVGCAQLFAGL